MNGEFWLAMGMSHNNIDKLVAPIFGTRTQKKRARTFARLCVADTLG